MDSQDYKRKVAFSVTNCICFDQRVMKMAETVATLNCDITIIGRHRGECCKSDFVPFRTHRFKMIFKRGFLFYTFFNIRIFFYLLFNRFDLLVANDLDTLLPNFLISKIKGLPLVYDSHEYFTGVPEIQNRPFVKWVWKTIEKWIFPGLENVITVSGSIAELYQDLYKVNAHVIRNLSKRSDGIIPYSKNELGIEESDIVLIIQGTGINVDKGSEELIEAVNVSFGVSLLVVGGGDVLSEIKRRTKELNIENKIKFFPSTTWENLMQFTKAADLGMCLEKDTNINYSYSLPNKLFDYISAGIPVIAGDLPETGKVIREFNIGIIISGITPLEISKAVMHLMTNRELFNELKRNSIGASEQLNWETESEKVKALYRCILSK